MSRPGREPGIPVDLLESAGCGLFQKTGGRDGASLPEVDRSLSSRLRQEAQETHHEVGGVTQDSVAGAPSARASDSLTAVEERKHDLNKFSNGRTQAEPKRPRLDIFIAVLLLWTFVVALSHFSSRNKPPAGTGLVVRKALRLTAI